MFVGALNQKALAWLRAQRDSFAGKRVVVGCSGSFSTELMLLRAGTALRGLHGNDVALFSYVLGAWLCGQDAALKPKQDAPDWLRAAWEPGAPAVAALHVLLEMLPYVKQRNPHQQRMWHSYTDQFGALVHETTARVEAMPRGLTSFTLGDVADHFRAHDGPDSVFVCYAPTYTGGYEKMYAALDAMFEWSPPQYNLLDEAGRDALLAWCRDGRRYVWYDDRKLDGQSPVLLQERGGMRTVYLYSNLLDRTGYFGPYAKRHQLPLPLANEETVLGAGDSVELLPMKCSDLADYKDQFLSKQIDHSPGMWAFAVCVGGRVVGFIELTRSKFGGSEVYVNSDFAVPNTRYARLSKLVVGMLLSRDVHRFLERKLLMRVSGVMTTAFTERPVSMKYRGLLELVKRGKKEDGRRYLNYEGAFTDKTAQETYTEWLNKYGSKTRSSSSIASLTA